MYAEDLEANLHDLSARLICTAEWLNEEPDVGNLLVRFCEGLRHNWGMSEIMWHRRETRRQTENPNVRPVALEGLILLDKNSCSLMGVVFQQATQPCRVRSDVVPKASRFASGIGISFPLP